MTVGCRGRKRHEGWTFADEAEAASWEGQTPEGQNPMDASGVKQTRKATGGGNRRGGAKPRGRNVSGEASPGTVDSCRGRRRRGRNPREGAGAERPSGGLCGSYPGGEQNLTRGLPWSVKSDTAGGSREDLRAERVGRITRRKANGEEGRAKPIRRYCGSPITLCRGTQPHEGKVIAGDRGDHLTQA
jgi:hypothetical protein